MYVVRQYLKRGGYEVISEERVGNVEGVNQPPGHHGERR